MEEARVQKNFPVKPKLKSKARTAKQTPESKYWSSFKTQQIPNLISVPSITFSPTPPHSFAAAHSASLTLFSSETLSPAATISSFSDAVTCASFRSDARLLASSDLSGLVQVFDVKSRTALRRLKSHSRPVRFVQFPRLDKLHLISAGDDALVKLWDVAEATPVAEFLGHKDYVRCGDCSPVNSEIFVTGSYDHVVKLWDSRVRDSKSSVQVNHGAPVEDVVFLPSGGMVATAGGNSVKLWDLIGGGKLVYSMESHNKTVTSICVGRIGKDDGEESSNQSRIMSVGLDGYLKVFDYGSLKVTHSMRFPAPLLSVAYSPDCSTRAIGTSNGVIYASKKKMKIKEKERESEASLFWKIPPVDNTEKKAVRPSHFRYFHRGQGTKPSKGDFLVMKPKKKKWAEHDTLLNKFEHGEALVSVLQTMNPGHVVAVLEELVARKKLLKCVSNLDVKNLELLLEFLHKYCTLPRYSSLLMGLAKKVLEMRVDDIRASDSEAIKSHIINLKRAVVQEIRIQQSLQEIQGIISPLLRIAGR